MKHTWVLAAMLTLGLGISLPSAAFAATGEDEHLVPFEKCNREVRHAIEEQAGRHGKIVSVTFVRHNRYESFRAIIELPGEMRVVHVSQGGRLLAREDLDEVERAWEDRWHREHGHRTVTIERETTVVTQPPRTVVVAPPPVAPPPVVVQPPTVVVAPPPVVRPNVEVIVERPEEIRWREGITLHLEDTPGCVRRAIAQMAGDEPITWIHRHDFGVVLYSAKIGLPENSRILQVLPDGAIYNWGAEPVGIIREVAIERLPHFARHGIEEEIRRMDGRIVSVHMRHGGEHPWYTVVVLHQNQTKYLTFDERGILRH